MRTALVTGASRGIGRGVALGLARQGFGMTITSRSTADLEHLAVELLAAGSPHVVHMAADMADRGRVPNLVEVHQNAFGMMSALVVNAGAGIAGQVAEFDLGRLGKTFDVNFSTPFALIQGVIPLLRLGAEADAVRGANIVGLSSITGAFSERGLAAYGASKAALSSLLETVGLEEARHGITSTAIAPGYVETDMSAWVTEKIPGETMIRVDDVVAVVDMLMALSRNASIAEVVIARSLSGGYRA